MEYNRRSTDRGANNRQAFSTRLLALNDNLESLYDVDLQTGAYTYFIKGESAYDEIKSQLFEREDFFTDTRRNAQSLIYHEDLETLCNVFTQEFIVEALRKDNYFDHYYRLLVNGTPTWFKVRIVYRDELKKNIIVGVINAEKEMELRQQALMKSELEHTKFKSDLLQYLSEHQEDPIKSLEKYAERLRCLFRCDQVIYRDLKRTRFVVNAPEIESIGTIPLEYCKQCEHFNAHSPLYTDGVVEMPNCEIGYHGVPTYHKCPVKSALTRLVYVNGEPVGYLAIHYLQDFHDFSDFERQTLEGLCRVMSLTISQYMSRQFAIKDAAKKKKAAAEKKLQNSHDRLRVDALSFIVDHECTALEFVEFISGRLLDVAKCDQVIYRDLDGNRYIKNSPKIGENYEIPEDYCSHCRHADPKDEVYKYDFTELPDCSNGFMGVPVFELCPVKSMMTRVVYLDGKVHGFISVHYIRDYHKFTDNEIRTFKEMAHIISLALSRLEARNTAIQLKKQVELRGQIEQNLKIIEGLASTYSAVYYVDLITNSLKPYAMNELTENEFGEDFTSGISFTEAWKLFVNKTVFVPDIDDMLKIGTLSNLKKQLKNKKTFSHIYRSSFTESIEYREITFVKCDFEDAKPTTLVVGVSNKHNEILEQKVIDLLGGDYASMYISDLDNNYCQQIIRSKSLDKLVAGKQRSFSKTSMVFADLVDEEDKEAKQFWESYSDPHWTKTFLADADRKEIVYRIPRWNHWYRSEFRVMERDANGEASKIITTSQIVDNEYAAKMAADNKLKEALAMAQSASRAKTTFLNNMSHDIRTPMNAIIGYTGLAATHLNNTELVQDYLTKIGQSSSHLLSLINDVLDMSRIESGKMNLSEKPESLSEIIHTIRSIVQNEIRDKELDFLIDSEDVYNEDVIVDKLRLNQVLLNTLSNAIKYTPSGGTVSMRISERAATRSGYASFQFKIKDNGIGMTEEFVNSIYDPFTRAKSSTISGIQGTGLGMSITKNIVDMMAGTIDVRSKEGKGTEVTICFDFKLAKKHHEPKKIKELEALRALVVDNDHDACISVYKMLQDVGMEAQWCTSGKEALIRAEVSKQEGDTFRVYIIDWNTPDMNGVEIARQIRKIVGDEAPIIILTAYDWSDIETEAREAGVTAFINKPIFPSDLHSVLSKCLSKEQKKKVSPKVAYHFAGKKVLLVEDNALNREISEELLKEDGIEVTSVEDGSLAVDKMKHAKKDDFDLILMDVQMPIMNGYEATKKIRALKNGVQNIPIIALTANAFEEDREAAMEAGMNEHVPKPINLKILRNTLSKFF